MSTKALRFFSTTIGKKTVMALTGVVLIGFIVGHMAGNLQVFMGREKLNAYAHFLQSMKGPLWIARLTLLACVGLHLWSAIALTVQNAGARPVRYHVKENLTTSYAARTMIWGGVLLGFFILFHLAHLTLGATPPAGFDRLDVYGNVVRGFQVEWISGFYIVAQLALGLHLYHGAWSFMQTLGASHPRYDRFRKLFAYGLAGLIVVGNISIPVAVLAGIVK